MSSTLSFMGANFWARDVDWQAPDFESIGRSTRARYEPLATYREAMDELLDVIASFDVEAVDLWVGHLDPAWATDDHVAIAVESISAHGLGIASLAGGFGEDLREFERTCEIAVGLGRPILGGNTAAWDSDRAGVLRLLEQHELRLAFENHPEEHTPADMLRKFGDAPPELVGTALDTGWWGTNGYDAALAIEELAERIMHVHLKDVLKVGEHVSCEFGVGVVPIRQCVRTLLDVGYSGAISIENGNDDVDPSDEIRASVAAVRHWLAGDES